jgi:hypothetical protein
LPRENIRDEAGIHAATAGALGVTEARSIIILPVTRRISSFIANVFMKRFFLVKILYEYTMNYLH